MKRGCACEATSTRLCHITSLMLHETGCEEKEDYTIWTNVQWKVGVLLQSVFASGVLVPKLLIQARVMLTPSWQPNLSYSGIVYSYPPVKPVENCKDTTLISPEHVFYHTIRSIIRGGKMYKRMLIRLDGSETP